jgi:hypothetical protein
MGTKCPMSPSSSCLIKPHNSHCPFVLSCNITYPFPMQTMHCPLVTPPILTNHTPPITSPYWPLDLHQNAEPQPYTFLNSLGHAHVRPFPMSTLQPLQLPMIRPPNLPPFPQHVHLTSTYTRRNVIHFDHIFVRRLYACSFLMCLLLNCHPINLGWPLKEIVKLWSTLFRPLWMLIMIRWCFR